MNMAEPSNVIRVPKPGPGSFNKHRPVSKLLRAQMEHLLEALKNKLDAEFRRGIYDADQHLRLETMKNKLEAELVSVSTEGEASAFIQEMTAILHPQGAKRKPSQK
jgi:hypothetical protein